MPVFFIQASQVQDEAVCVTGSLCDHLRASLRLQVGEEFWLGDERRHRYRVAATSITRQAITGRVLEERTGPAPTGPGLILGQALLKGDRMDWLIQKATELGVATLVPLVTSRTVVRPRAARLASQRDRWQTIALEAAQQSERWDIPTVSPPGDAAEFFRQQSSSSVRIILAERSSGKSLDRIPLPRERGKLVVLAIGPEGGWTEEETGQALESGFVPVTLGPRILRAETAALAALSVLQSRLGELG